MFGNAHPNASTTIDASRTQQNLHTGQDGDDMVTVKSQNFGKAMSFHITDLLE